MVAATLIPDPPPLLTTEALIAAVCLDRGILARCPCGHSRYCPFTESCADDYEQFHKLHARCLRA